MCNTCHKVSSDLEIGNGSTNPKCRIMTGGGCCVVCNCKKCMQLEEILLWTKGMQLANGWVPGSSNHTSSCLSSIHCSLHVTSQVMLVGVHDTCSCAAGSASMECWLHDSLGPLCSPPCVYSCQWCRQLSPCEGLR